VFLDVVRGRARREKMSDPPGSREAS
jgi:hypothetical protein